MPAPPPPPSKFLCHQLVLQSKVWGHFQWRSKTFLLRIVDVQELSRAFFARPHYFYPSIFHCYSRCFELRYFSIKNKIHVSSINWFFNAILFSLVDLKNNFVWSTVLCLCASIFAVIPACQRSPSAQTTHTSPVPHGPDKSSNLFLFIDGFLSALIFSIY